MSNDLQITISPEEFDKIEDSENQSAIDKKLGLIFKTVSIQQTHCEETVARLEPHEYLLPPLPNAYFTRDPAVIVATQHLRRRCTIRREHMRPCCSGQFWRAIPISVASLLHTYAQKSHFSWAWDRLV